MTYDFKQTHLSKAIFAGVFTGLIASVATLIFNGIYRNITGFTLSDIINVSSLIFIPMIILELCALCYHLLEKNFKQAGVVLYIILFVIISAICIYLSFQTHRSPDAALTAQFRWLLFGVVAILGFTASFLIPYFFKHDELYN